MDSEKTQMEPGMTGAPDAPTAVGDKNIFSVVAEMFSSPRRAFESYSRRVTIIIPLIIIVLLVALSAGLMAPYSTRAQMEILQYATAIPPQLLEQMKAQSAETSPMALSLKASIAGGIMGIIMTLLMTLIVWPIAGFIFGAEVRFKSLWGVVLLSSVISQIGMILRVPLMVLKDTVHVSYGLAALMPGADFRSILYNILYYFDFFAIWSLIVAGIGFAVVCRLSTGKGMVMSAISSVIVTMLMVGMTLIGMSFAGVKVSFF